MADTAIDLDNNVEGLDWTKIAERVSRALIIALILLY